MADDDTRYERWREQEERNAEREEQIKDAMHRIRIRREAEMRLNASSFPTLPEETLKEALERPEVEPENRIHELLPSQGNALLTAERKTGKTTLALNLAAALADGRDFLGFQVKPMLGRVAFINYEMSEWQLNAWLRRMQIKNPERIVPFHLRGQGTPFMFDRFREVLADRLIELDVEVLILDPVAKAWRSAVENENNNSEVSAFLAAVDEVKRTAGIGELIVTHHMGRAEQAEGAERGRGAIALEDWADALWVLTKDKEGQRVFRADEGRDVNVAALDLGFDRETGRFSRIGYRAQRRAESTAMQAVAAVMEAGGSDVPTATVDGILRREGMKSQNDPWKARKAAVQEGWLKEPQPDPNDKRSLRYSLTSQGRKIAEDAA